MDTFNVEKTLTMKKVISLIFSVCIFVAGCQKERFNTPANDNSFVDSSIQFLKSALSSDDFAKLDMTSAQVLLYKNKNIGIQVFEKNVSRKKFLLLHADSGKYSGNWIDMSGLVSTSPKSMSGVIVMNNINGATSAKLIVNHNVAIQLIKNDNMKLNSQTINFVNSGSVGIDKANSSDDNNMLPEVVIYYDVNWRTTVNYSSLYWMFSEDSYYSNSYYNPDGGGGGGINNVVDAPNIYFSRYAHRS